MAMATQSPICSSSSNTALISDTISQEPDFSAADAALRIDHILEEIFKSVDTRTLKSCRLVSQTWKFFGTLELQERIENRIKLSFYRREDPPYFREVFVHQTEIKTATAVQKVTPEAPEVDPLQTLIGLIQSSPNFPCNSFILETRQFEKPHIQSLLFYIGHAIKTLTLKLDLVHAYSPCDLLMTGLKTILTNRVPNLESLSITLLHPSKWNQYVTGWDRNLFEKQPQSQSVILLPKLKYLKIEGAFPKTAFEEIMNAAVNLKSLHLDQIEYFELTLSLSYFIDGNGKFRIHILKHLNVYFWDTDDGHQLISLFEKLLKQHSKNLALESIQIRNCSSSRHRPQELRAKADEVIGQFLEGSSATLKKLFVSNLTSLSSLKSIPQMPKLKTLVLIAWEEIKFDTNYYTLFRSGFSGRNFPALKSCLVILGHSSFERDFLPKLFLKLMSSLRNNNNNPEAGDDEGTNGEAEGDNDTMFVPITSVESVELIVGNGNGTEEIYNSTRKICSIIFPNARVTEVDLDDHLAGQTTLWTSE